MSPINFKLEKKIPNALGRAGVLSTPHGEILTPAFVTVGTKGTVKSLTPEQILSTGSQVVLANTYHLYLQPGEKIIKEAGGLGKFMNWSGPTFTDSGGFQAFSLGVAFGEGIGKFIGANTPEPEMLKSRLRESSDEPRKAKVTEEGVEFVSILDGSKHFMSPEDSIRIQRDIGADMIFALDEFTSPHADHDQIKATIDRTLRWAERCLKAMKSTHPLTPSQRDGEDHFGYHTTDSLTWRTLQDKVTEMRKNPTKAEEVLWKYLRGDLTSFHFRRQHIIGNFVVDFVCLEKSLIVEVDGDIHDYQRERDEERTKFLEQRGFKVIRFRNEEVLSNIEVTIVKIVEVLKALPFGEGLGGVVPKQALFGIVQGGRHEDLRKESAKSIGALPFDGFGIGGTFIKEDMATAVKWVNEILPEDKPRHLLGVAEPIDLFLGVENGCDTFDCVAATRMSRNGGLYTRQGKININNAKYKDDLTPFLNSYTFAYIHHLFKAKEMLAATLATIHNLTFINTLMSEIRQSILDGNFAEFKEEFLKEY